MDSVFVRKAHRGNGHGLRMLEDFVDSFKEDALGLKYPISPAMYKGEDSGSIRCSGGEWLWVVFQHMKQNMSFFSLSPVCGCYLSTYPADQDLLWEVESIGGPFQRSQVAIKIQEKSEEGSLSPSPATLSILLTFF